MGTITDRAPTSNFCQLCTAVLTQDIRYGPKDEPRKFQSLKESAQDGCPMCNWLWNSIPWLSRLDIDDISFCRRRGAIPTDFGATWSQWCEFIDETQSIKRVTSGIDRPIPPSRYDAVCVLAPFETNILSNAYRPSVNTGASETFHLAREWMHRCISSHVSCAAYRRPGWAPTRLLKVFPKDDGKISAKLEERDDGQYSSAVKYLALSHRWLGDNESPLLSEENRSRFRDDIEISSLKASIRDAICATVRLGIHYLWVDTLCVLQDSEDDKTHEIGRMDSIFSNALCTIAAGIGETADEGCFTSRNVNQVTTHGVHLRLGGNEPQYCLMRLSWTDTNRELDHTSLSGRGWTFQERFLSPRTLHFCAKQVHWECRELRANEVHPEGDPTQRNWLLDRRFAGLANPWMKIIESYTARSLTFPADRLRAIQGVADFIHRNSNVKDRQTDKYLHGLWQSSLPRSLLWIVDGQPKHNRLTEVAPTWSWASTNEEVSFHNYYLTPDYNPLIDILEVVSGSDIRIPGADREGEIKDAKDDVLRIRGRFYRSPGQQEADATFGPYVEYDCKDAKQSGSDAKIEYLPMYKSGPQERNGHPMETLEGIAVRALGGDDSKIYERVGKYKEYCRLGVTDFYFKDEQDIYLC